LNNKGEVKIGEKGIFVKGAALKNRGIK